MPRSTENYSQAAATQILKDCGLQLRVEHQLDARGRVFKARDPYSKLYRCVKILDFSRATRQRLEALRRIDDHEQIVPGIIEVRRSGEKLVLVSKWIQGHPLRQYLRASHTGHHAGISLHQCLMMFCVFANHLSSLHRAGFIVHGDIKPENLLISKRRTWKLVLIDFGSSWNAEQTIHRHAGDGITPVYAAPECQSPSGIEANYLSDQFSASVVLFEMLTGEIPYARLGGTVGNKSIDLEIPSSMLSDKTPYPQPLLKQVDTLVCQGLRLNPDERFAGSRDWPNAAYRAAELLKPTRSTAPAVSWSERLQSLWRR